MQAHDTTKQPGERGSIGVALVIEADPAYSAVMETCAHLAGCRTEAVPSPEQALDRLRRRFDLILWGVGYRESDSERIRILTQLREATHTPVPIIMLDDHFEPAQVSYESGADHVLPKPFVPGALVGAIKSALRKAPSLMMQLASRVEIRGMVLDAERRVLEFGDRRASFTGLEWELLAVFLTHPNRFLTAADIFQLSWSAGRHREDQLRGYVHRLRQKLDPLALPCALISQQGRGYCLRIE